MSQPMLFRPEAVAHASFNIHGTVMLDRPLRGRLLSLLAVAMTIALLAIASLLSFTSRAAVQGRLVPADGLVHLRADARGIVVTQLVAEGQAVHANDTLFVLSRRQPLAASDWGDEAARSLASRRANLALEKTRLEALLGSLKRVRESRARQLHEQQVETANQVAFQERRLAIAQAEFARLREMADSGYMSPLGLANNEAKLLEQRQALAEVRSRHAEQGQEIARLEAEALDQDSGARTQLATIERELAATGEDQARLASDLQAVVRAPRDGVVSAIATAVGDAVAPDQQLADLLPPRSELIAELDVPSDKAGFLSVGTPVQLRYDAFPHQKFGVGYGRIFEISRSTSRDATPGAPPTYRVRVRLDSQTLEARGESHGFAPGMTLQASLTLGHRRVIDLLIDPFRTFKGHAALAERLPARTN